MNTLILNIHQNPNTPYGCKSGEEKHGGKLRMKQKSIKRTGYVINECGRAKRKIMDKTRTCQKIK